MTICRAKDALLGQINGKLGLRIDPDHAAEIDLINAKLKLKNKQTLLRRLNKLRSQKSTWYWNLNKIRIMGTHTALINILVSTTVGSTKPAKITFRIQPDQSLEVVPYLEKCIKKMKDLIQHTIDQEPLLQ